VSLAVAALLLVVALGAAYRPVRRALDLDPMAVRRSER
jgi:predicted lysophospholipase L1 biosynthesis ABC-type transport system permease subunit